MGRFRKNKNKIDKLPMEERYVLVYSAIIDKHIKDSGCATPKSNSEKRFPYLPTITEKKDAIEWLTYPAETHEKDGWRTHYEIPLVLCCKITGRDIIECQKMGGV